MLASHSYYQKCLTKFLDAKSQSNLTEKNRVVTRNLNLYGLFLNFFLSFLLFAAFGHDNDLILICVLGAVILSSVYCWMLQKLRSRAYHSAQKTLEAENFYQNLKPEIKTTWDNTNLSRDEILMADQFADAKSLKELKQLYQIKARQENISLLIISSLLLVFPLIYSLARGFSLTLFAIPLVITIIVLLQIFYKRWRAFKIASQKFIHKNNSSSLL